MNRTLYVHLGWPKTGSSFIQSILYSKNNLQTLADQGIYPINGIFDHRSMKELDRIRQASVQEISERLAHHITESKGASKLVYSQESIAVLDAEDIEKLKQAFSHVEVKIIFYLRRQDGYCESAWKQWLIKESSFEEYYEDYLKKPVPYLRRLRLWSHAFGKENIIVRRYGKKYLPDGLGKDFFSLIGVDIEQLKLDAAAVNTGFSRDLLEIIYKSRENLKGIHDHRLNRVFAKYIDDQGPYTNYQLLSPDQRRKVLKLHLEENQTISREFIGEESDLFDMDVSDANYSPYEGLDIDFAVKFLSRIVLDQFDEIRDLNYQVASRRPVDERSLLSKVIGKIKAK